MLYCAAKFMCVYVCGLNSTSATIGHVPLNDFRGKLGHAVRRCSVVEWYYRR